MQGDIRILVIYSAESSKTLSGSEYSIRLEGSYLLSYYEPVKCVKA